MSKLKNYSGTYNLVGKYLIHTQNPIKLLLTERQETTTKKALRFLLDKTNKSGSYVSSLYDADVYDAWQTGSLTIENYFFDYQNVNYTLTIDKQNLKAEIKTTYKTEKL